MGTVTTLEQIKDNLRKTRDEVAEYLEGEPADIDDDTHDDLVDIVEAIDTTLGDAE